MRPNNPANVMTRLARLARIRVAPDRWDLLLRASTLAALASLVVSYVFPSVSDLAAFFTLMFIACGPTSAFLPAASEPVLIAFGQLYAPLLLAGIGIVAVVLVEFINYSLFDAVLHSERMSKVRGARITRLVVRYFETQPFATVAVAAFSPIPFWTARTCAVLSRYSVPRYMCATGLGRFFRLFLIAAIGTVIPLTIGQTVGGAATLIVVIGLAVLLRHYWVRRRQLVTPA